MAKGARWHVVPARVLDGGVEGGYHHMYHPAWKDWFRARHQEACQQSGTGFEDYVSKVLSLAHRDFVNPDPAGSLGDFGCDGVAEAGTHVYACYGKRSTTMNERNLADKIPRDYRRASDNWECMTVWRFVTNGIVGPLSTKAIVTLQAQNRHPGLDRPVAVTLWRPEDLWHNLLQGMDVEQLSKIFPGAPGVVDLELSDLIPLVAHIEIAAPEESQDLTAQDADKMEFNSLPLSSRIELDEGRLYSRRLERWFASQDDIELEDKRAARFNLLYREHRATGIEARPLLERLYVAVGGQDFRMDARRANGVFAVTAYFFDKCHIFERPPVGWTRMASGAPVGGGA